MPSPFFQEKHQVFPLLVQQNVIKQQLPNGVRILIDRTDHFRSASLAFCLLGGIRDEQVETVGATHLVEHLLFKRTTARDSQMLATFIDELGGTATAFTDSDLLCLTGTVPGRDLGTLLAFFAELTLNSAFTDQDLLMEKEVIKQEILEANDNPLDALYQAFAQNFWPDSTLRFPVFGTLETLHSTTAMQVRQRLAQLMVAKRLIIAVSGNVDEQRFIKEVEALFGQLPAGETMTFVPPNTASGFVCVPRVAKQSYLLFAQPWPCLMDEDYLAGVLVSTILGDGCSSRLFQLLRERHGLAYTIEAEVDSHRDTAALLISATVEQPKLTLSLDLILDQLTFVGDKALQRSELERVQKLLSAQLEMAADSLSGRLWRALDLELTFQRYLSVDEVVARICAITIDDLERFVAKWLGQNRALLVLGGDVEDYEPSETILQVCGGAQRR